MKKLSILPFLLCVMVSSGQKNSNNIEESFEMYGYVNGIRLDSIKASYAQVYYKSLAPKKTASTDSQYPDLSNSPAVICFSYAKVKNNEELAVKDNKGKYISLSGDYSELLNFLHFNGWELFKIVYIDSMHVGFYSLLKKIEVK